MAHEVAHATVPGGAADRPRAPAGDVLRARRRFDAVGALALVVVAAGVAVRLVFLGNQSYWADEIFSVTQASGSLRQVVDVGGSEIHTPFYACVLWCWERLGGSSTAWTHGMSAVLGLGTVVASFTGLRAAGLSSRARRLAVALTAAGGFGIVYAQESRPYALVLLGATGLTAATVRQHATAAGAVEAPPPPSRRLAVWAAWALLTSAAHLLGAALVGVTALALAAAAVRRRRPVDAWPVLGLGAMALVPQLAWIAAGSRRSGFAAGTSWIHAPAAGDVRMLLTTVFPAGGLRPRADGFAWTSPVGVAVVVVLLVVAGALRWSDRSPGRSPDWSPDREGPAAAADAQAVRDLRMGLVLLAVAAAMLAGVFVIAQFVHVWTLRNMIVVVPALTWGSAWVVCSLPRREGYRRAMAVAVLAATLVSVGAVAADLRHPYKADWRGLIRYLAQVRAAEPSATFSSFTGDPLSRVVAADEGPEPSPYLHRIDRRLVRYPESVQAVRLLRRARGPQVVVFYRGAGRPDPEDVWPAIRDRLADPRCRLVPVYGLVVVACP